MVKGISRQVIVVHAPEPELFEQAIFILKDGSRQGITDEMLLREAKKALRGEEAAQSRRSSWNALLWAGLGAVLTGVVWLLWAVL